MIDVRLLRNDPETVRALLARRHKPELLVQLQEAETLDARLRDITTERDTTRAKVNELSKQVGALRRSGDNDAAEALMAQSRSLGDAEHALVAEFDQLTDSLRDVREYNCYNNWRCRCASRPVGDALRICDRCRAGLV